LASSENDDTIKAHTWLLRLATLLELRIVLGGVEEALAAFCGECNTISFECMHPGNGVFEKVSLDKLKGSAGSDGNTHIRVREEQF